MKSTTHKDLTIAICTYNRAKFLDLGLNALLQQTIPSKKFEILIIDNNSSDNSFDVFKSYENQFDSIKYIKELKQGISYARNSALKACNTKWLLFLDDDAKAHSNLVEETIKIISDYKFNCFGGRYFGWFDRKKPSYIPEGFGSKKNLSNKVIELSEPLLESGVMCVEKEVAIAIGGFSTEVGHFGKVKSYGEDIELQIKLLASNYKLGYTPNMIIDHWVDPEKLKFKNIMYLNYVSGKDSVKYKTENTLTLSLLERIKTFLIILHLNSKRIIKELKIEQTPNKTGKFLFQFTRALGYNFGVYFGAYFDKKESKAY